MALKEIVEKIDKAEGWKERYQHYVPKFIEEASNKTNWDDWDTDVFHEYFEKRNQQCISSLRQGYFSEEEKNVIKENWSELAPLLKTIALNQDTPQWDTYISIKQTLRKYTTLDLRAATNRLIAGLQPNLLSTIVNENMLYQLFKLLQKENIEELPSYVGGNWFKNSYAILQLFRKELGQESAWDIITYPWQTFVYLTGTKSTIVNDMSETDDNDFDRLIDLLKYKKQIILQGPPGTGKTRLAELVGKKLTTDIVPQIDDISKYINVGDKIKTPYDKLIFVIEAIEPSIKRITVKPTNAKNTYNVTFDQIISCISAKGWKDPIDKWNKSGTGSYIVGIAKSVHAIITNSHIKLIQFHPSYSYEDFVRGITAESVGNQIEYKAKNKILAEFASQALKNLKDSKKEESTISEEKWLDDQFGLFVDLVTEQLAENGIIEITGKVNIIGIEEDAFRYKGTEGWSVNGNRMLFKDIKQAYLDKNAKRQDIKHNKNLSGLANWHASYYIRVLEMFKEFLDSNTGALNRPTVSRIPLKNYVLIIDEINRANLSSVLGELIYALEYRGKTVESMYEVEGEGQQLILPPNLYIIGTMNTADRSVGHIDYAIRRRFAFVDVLPKILEDNSLDEGQTFDANLFINVGKLFIDDYKGQDIKSDQEIKKSAYLSNEFDPKDVMLGHSYFIEKKSCSMEMRLMYEIKPILMEYVKDGVLRESAVAVINKLAIKNEG